MGFLILACGLITVSWVTFAIWFTIKEGELESEKERADAFFSLYQAQKANNKVINDRYYSVLRRNKVQSQTLETFLNETNIKKKKSSKRLKSKK